VQYAECRSEWGGDGDSVALGISNTLDRLTEVTCSVGEQPGVVSVRACNAARYRAPDLPLRMSVWTFGSINQSLLQTLVGSSNLALRFPAINFGVHITPTNVADRKLRCWNLA